MSGDPKATSFGHPNAQPPTPSQTPTSAVLPSPVFETPRQTSGRLDESGGWTPRFAEEYSVFNATPGNLRGSHGHFGDFAPTTPYLQSAGHKRQFSAEGIAAEIATHVTHFSPNPSLPLPPVDPSRCLPSSTSPATPSFDQSIGAERPSDLQERSVKKLRRDSPGEPEGQTATPPPSGRKGERRLAPKTGADKMQSEQGYGQPEFLGTPQQPQAPTFVTTPSDAFGYPMSAPATAPVYSNTRVFWDAEVSMDPSMSGMAIDFSAGDPNMFNTPTSSHRPMGSLDWSRSNQIFQTTGVVPHSAGGLPQQMHAHPQDASASSQQMFTGTFPAGMEDPFGIVSPGAGVNPGLLFSRPPSSSMDAQSFNPSQPPSSSAPAAPQGLLPSQTAATQPEVAPRGELRRSASVKDMTAGKRPESTPIKAAGRPGLLRSFSENRGKKPNVRTSFPALAPAPRPAVQLSSTAGVNANRPVAQGGRAAGRLSPSKNHQRLSSLTSIPEISVPRTRTSVKFTIDANGRARAETTVVAGDQEPSSARKPARAGVVDSFRRWESSDDDSSSTDDDPIIIPSRNTSFALPDPRKPSSAHPFHSSQRSVSERSATSTYFQGGDAGDGDSEAETVTNELVQLGKTTGDATSELRKLIETRQKRLSAPKMNAAGMAAFSGGGQFVSGSTISPTTLTETSLPTPSTDTRSHGIRCVCNRPEASLGDGFMVQCESCEMWLHGRCINISKRTLPSVYICAFCANTPNMRGGRLRDNGRVVGAPGGQNTSMSPLAHKSFKSFR